MEKKSFSFYLITLLAVTFLANAESNFCWRDTTTRGAGYIPNKCNSAQDLIGLLCYDKCPSGYQRFGFDCHQTCKDGWTDQGLFCRLCEYGRGAGYPWKFGDGMNNDGMLRRCRADNPGNDCEMWGAVAYPKCKTGYSPAGCCICRPAVPDCNKEGYNGGIDLSCAKKIIIGTPHQGGCETNHQKDGLLCYPKCPTGYNGVGPVCWGNPPQGWVQCGMGAADTSQTCTKKVFQQVTQVGKVIINIATLGTANSAQIAENQSSKLPEIYAKLMPLIKQIKQVYEQGGSFKDFMIQALKDAAKAANAADIIEKLSGDISKMTPAEIVSLGAQIASLYDPTGIANLIKAYSYDICSRMKAPIMVDTS